MKRSNALKRPILLESGLILLLALVCCRAPRAAEFSYTPPNLVESGASATATGHRAESGPEKGQQDRTLSSIALLTSSRPKHSEDLPLKSPPVDLGSAEVLARDLSAKWADLQSRIRSEEVIIAACRANSAGCSAGARRLLQIVELGRQREGRARLGEINRAVNMSIRPVSDWAQYGIDDFWSSPLATLSAGAGDCEDYAIVKYIALREAGIDPDDLRLLIVRYPRRKTNHAILAVRVDADWLILDNLTLIMVNILEAEHYHPLFALNQRGVSILASANARDRIAGSL
jgi:predicted transglutaminase-like cysteine proteinase